MSQQSSGPIGEAGASVAEDSAALLPCLKERVWAGREHAVCRVLWANTASAYMPWAAVGYDRPSSFQFITTKDCAEMRTTEAALEARALANLRQRPAKWERVDIDSKHGSRFTILRCGEDFFAAERILDPDFLKEAQRTLRARGLLVGIPRRGRLYCVNGELPQDALQGFGTAIAQEFVSGESAPISPMLFAVKDGAIVEIVESIADAILPQLESERDEEQGDANAPYMSVVTLRNDQGTEDVQLMIGGDEAAQIANGVQRGVHHILQQHLTRKEFSGNIEVVVLGYTPDEAKVHLPEVMAQLQGYCDDLSKKFDKKLRVSLEHQKSSWPTSPAARPAARPAASPAAKPAKAAPVGKPKQRVFLSVVNWLLLVLVLVLFWQLLEYYARKPLY
jgi:hypothetical protein